jgi:cytochrome c oxidase cbb3-type subunit 3
MHDTMGWVFRAAITTMLVGGAVGGVGCTRSEARSGPDGARVFATYCARCHGTEGRGGLPLWDGGPAPRNFHDPTFHAARTEEQLRTTVHDGKPPGMPPFGAVLSPEEIAAVVRHVRTLRGAEEGR